MRNVDLQKVKYEGCILKGVNIPLSRGISRIPSRSAWRDKYPGTRKTRDLLNPSYMQIEWEKWDVLFMYFWQTIQNTQG